MIEDRIRERILVDVLDQPPPVDIDLDTDLINNDVLDSLGIFLLIECLQADFGISVRDNEVTLADFSTLRTIGALVRRKLG